MPISMMRRLTGPAPFRRATVTVWPTLASFSVLIACFLPLICNLQNRQGGSPGRFTKRKGPSVQDAARHLAVQGDAAVLHLQDQAAGDLVDHRHRAVHHKAELGQVLAHLVPPGDPPDGDSLTRPCHRQRHHTRSLPSMRDAVRSYKLHGCKFTLTNRKSQSLLASPKQVCES